MNKDTIKIKQALKALQAHHDWHKDNDDYDGYQGSALCEITENAIANLNAEALAALEAEQPASDARQFTAADALRQRPHMQHLNAASASVQPQAEKEEEDGNKAS